MDLASLYHYYYTELADPRMKDYFFVRYLSAIIILTIAYLYIVLKCGPEYMKNRKAYELKTFIKVYNVFQVIVNFLIIYHSVDAGWYDEHLFHCNKIDYGYSPEALKLTRMSYYILCLKIFDYIETIVFVLRKKNEQVTFLHLYHHVSTVLLSWYLAKYFALGATITVAIVNCGVHVIMYGYYYLSSFGPIMQRLLRPIKQSITIIQMVQFWVLILYAMQGLFEPCRQLMTPAILIIMNLLINFALFYNFYQKTYKSKQNKVK